MGTHSHTQHYLCTLCVLVIKLNENNLWKERSFLPLFNGLSSRMAQLTGAQGGWSHGLRILHILHHHCLEVSVQAKKPFHTHGVSQTCPSPASQRKNPLINTAQCSFIPHSASGTNPEPHHLCSMGSGQEEGTSGELRVLWAQQGPKQP